MANQNIILICGKSATGKTASLRNIKDPGGVLYLNAESNKSLPFPAKFKTDIVTDPMLVYKYFTWAETKEEIHTIVIDSLSFLMDMFESVYVIPASDGREAWGQYQQYFKNLMQQYVATSTKNVIFLAHTASEYNEKELAIETFVKIKGALRTQGIEAYFNQVIATKKVSLSTLEEYENPLLNITDLEKQLGFKYVYQCNLTEDTMNERIRGPMGLWDVAHTYIDNDIQHVIDKVHNYYN
jgi:hypothetical protein